MLLGKPKHADTKELKRLMEFTGATNLEELITGSLSFLSRTVTKVQQSNAVVIGKENITQHFVLKAKAAANGR